MDTISSNWISWFSYASSMALFTSSRKSMQEDAGFTEILNGNIFTKVPIIFFKSLCVLPTTSVPTMISLLPDILLSKI
jgi:hypothetical protein